MTDARPSPDTSLRSFPSLARFRVWHLWLLALFVAVAIVNIQDQGRNEAALVALAAVGFTIYGLVGLGVWRFCHRFRARLGPLPVSIFALVALAALFLIATVAYLLIEHAYLAGVLDLARLPGAGRFLGPW